MNSRVTEALHDLSQLEILSCVIVVFMENGGSLSRL